MSNRQERRARKAAKRVRNGHLRTLEQILLDDEYKQMVESLGKMLAERLSAAADEPRG